MSGVVDTDATGLVDVSELAAADLLDGVTTELEGVGVGVVAWKESAWVLATSTDL